AAGRRLPKHRNRRAVVGRPKAQNLLRLMLLLGPRPGVDIKARERERHKSKSYALRTIACCGRSWTAHNGSRESMIVEAQDLTAGSDRPPLEALCCECYQVVKNETQRLMPTHSSRGIDT
ncbi:MAG: hypothetical protein ACREUT_01100, partial [Steroidobacteraceae bacterium]